ncbi:MAG TPA: TolC family protein, partial [Polyangiales bacterium]|nr:TolC family protein [Polyangiales bacterium]
MSLLDAVRSALRRHPSIAVARVDAASAEAQVMAAQAPFDTSLGIGLSHDRVRTPGELTGIPGQQINDTTTLGVSAQKAFRWGMQLQPSVSLSRIHGRNSPSLMGLPGDPVQQAHAELALIQPLLRGAGTIGSASGIREAERRRDGQLHLLAHSAQAQALDVIQAYYQLSASEQELVLARE